MTDPNILDLRRLARWADLYRMERERARARIARVVALGLALVVVGVLGLAGLASYFGPWGRP